MDVHGSVGDELVVDTMHLGEPARRGEILEVIGTGDGIHYRVRWNDNGHESLFYPGTTSHVVHPSPPR
jgi:Domain of unknown function (DUF1918)